MATIEIEVSKGVTSLTVPYYDVFRPVELSGKTMIDIRPEVELAKAYREHTFSLKEGKNTFVLGEVTYIIHRGDDQI